MKMDRCPIWLTCFACVACSFPSATAVELHAVCLEDDTQAEFKRQIVGALSRDGLNLVVEDRSEEAFLLAREVGAEIDDTLLPKAVSIEAANESGASLTLDNIGNDKSLLIVSAKGELLGVVEKELAEIKSVSALQTFPAGQSVPLDFCSKS